MYSDQNKSWASHVGCSLQVDIMTNPVVEWQTEEDAFWCTYAVSWQSESLSSTTSHKTWTHDQFCEGNSRPQAGLEQNFRPA